MTDVRVWGADAGDFLEGRLIWSALNVLKPAKAEPPAVVDLSDLQLVRPYALAAIGALGCLADRKARLVMPATQLARDHVVRSGLGDFFVLDEGAALPHSRRTVPVRQLVRPDASFTDDITRAWDGEFGGMSPGIRPRLADHLDEMIRNALAHAASPIGCLVAAQVFPGVPSVEVAIMDLGQTIRGHLTKQDAYRGLTTDAAAIEMATREGVSGTAPGALNVLGEPNSGIGLYELREYCEAGGGEMTIVSGTELMVFRLESKPVIRPFAGGFPGCLVNIRFRV